MKETVADLSIAGRMVLKWILQVVRWEGMGWIQLAHDKDTLWPIEHSNEHIDFTKCGKFLD
jgi:hypothetical protein